MDPSTTADEGRMVELISAISQLPKGLDLKEIIEISKRLGWQQEVGNAPKGSWYPGDDVSIEECLREIESNHDARLDIGGPTTSWVCLTPRRSGDYRAYKILDMRWVPVFEALIQRNQTTKAVCP